MNDKNANDKKKKILKTDDILEKKYVMSRCEIILQQMDMLGPDGVGSMKWVKLANDYIDAASSEGRTCYGFNMDGTPHEFKTSIQ